MGTRGMRRRTTESRFMIGLAAAVFTVVTIGVAQATNTQPTSKTYDKTDWNNAMRTDPAAPASPEANGDKDFTTKVLNGVPCKEYSGDGSVTPYCKRNTAGTYLDVVISKPIGGSTIRVNSSFETTIRKLLTDAKKAGFTLDSEPTASYRTELLQQQFRAKSLQEKYRKELDRQVGAGELPANFTAEQAAAVLKKVSDENAYKAASAHQWGLAFDIQCNGKRLDDPSVADCMTWMKTNAANYGLKQFPKEIFHFSTTGK